MRAVIFDMDGVLINSMKYHISSWKEAFKSFGLKTTNRELSLFEGMSFRETIKIISKNNNVELSQEDIDTIYSTKKEILNKTLEFDLFDEITKILEFLRSKNVKLGVVTGSNKEFAHSIIDKYFKDVFDIVITSDDVDTGKGKPHPEPYLKAIDELNLKTNEAIVIENAPLGIKSAKTAGLRVIALETTLNRDDLLDSDLVLKNHKELWNYFNNENKN